MGRQDSYEDMDEPLLMRGQERQVIIVGFPDVGRALLIIQIQGLGLKAIIWGV